MDGYLAYLEIETFPGGCFFSSTLAEMDTQPGPVRDRLVAFLGDWLGRIETAVRDTQAEGAIDPAEDAAQLTFEIEAALFLANAQYVVARTPEPNRTGPPSDPPSPGLGRERSEGVTTGKRASTPPAVGQPKRGLEHHWTLPGGASAENPRESRSRP